MKKIAYFLLLPTFLGLVIVRLANNGYLNILSLSLNREVNSTGISVLEMGLYLHYDPSLDISISSNLLAGCDKKTSSNLAFHLGISYFRNREYETAERCLKTINEQNLKGWISKILLMDIARNAGNESAITESYKSLPVSLQINSNILARMLLDFSSGLGISSEIPKFLDNNLTNLHRYVLFDLNEDSNYLANKFLDDAVSRDLMSQRDKVDYESLSIWLSTDQTLDSELDGYRRIESQVQLIKELISDRINCSENDLHIENNLITAGSFESVADLHNWVSLPWTSDGSTKFNKGKFIVGIEFFNQDSGIVALRISGLWKTEDKELIPAYGSYRNINPFETIENSLYLGLIRYKTENLQNGFPSIWFLDQFGNRRFIEDWKLEETDNNWNTLFVLSSLENNSGTILTPIINQFALGTIWIDYLVFYPVTITNCEYQYSVPIKGEIVN